MKTKHCKIVWKNGMTSEFESTTDPFELDINRMADAYGTQVQSISFYVTEEGKRPASEDEVGTAYFWRM